MNVATASAPTALKIPAAAARPWVSYALFTLCAALYLLPFMRLFMVGTDEGIFDYGAARVLHGQVFSRDFFEVMGPGTFYWLAVYYKLFGVTFLATRVCLFISSLGTAIVMYFLSRRICPTYRFLPCIILFATYFGGLWPAISHHVDSNFFALSAIACFVLWIDRRVPVLLFAAGALAGVTTCFLQPKGAFILCAFLVWLWLQRHHVSSSTLALVAAGFIAVLAPVLIYFASKGALGSLIFDNYIWPSQHYESVNAVGYAHGLLSLYWHHWVLPKPGFGWLIPMGAVLMIPLLFIAALPALLPVLAARFKGGFDKPEIQLFWLCGVAIWLSEIHRPDMARLIFGAPLLIILCVYFLAQYRSAIAEHALQLLAIGACCLAAFNLCCLLLAAHTVTTRVGNVKLFQPAPLLAFLDKNVSPGEEIFTYPYCPRYYFFSATTNPTPYSMLVSNYNTPDQYRDVVRILDSHKVKYVFWDKGFVQASEAAFPGSRQAAGSLIVEPYLESHYTPLQVVGDFQVMQRKGK